ncbi:glycosyltransferase family 4 protein [Tsuneonella sp. SYSU-LHT278]|uniref:glycosyltransferase family 4 protein n=1 Tax=Tsuneonella sediminis TaxID=3416089 RepID=UPI003F78D182
MIVIVYPQLEGVGGIARYLRSFLANYPPDAPELLVLAGDRGPAVSAPPNVTVEYLGMAADRGGQAKWSLAVRRRLKAIARTGKLQAINLQLPPLIPALMVQRLAPIIVTAHTTYLGMSGQFYSPRRFTSHWSAMSIAIKKAIERTLFARASAIISLTEQGRQEIERYGYKGPVAVLPNGVDIAQFAPSIDPMKTIDVIFTGRIEKRKGSRPMVEIVRRLVAARPGIRICIVGYGEDEDHVRAELGGLGDRVELTGKIPFDQIAARLDAATVYASASYYEGLPGTCMEAMAMRLPAVVWDFPFYNGLVDDGATGRRVPPNDMDGFVGAVTALLDRPDKACAMGARGRTRVEAEYDWANLSPRIAAEMAEHAGRATAAR